MTVVNLVRWQCGDGVDRMRGVLVLFTVSGWFFVLVPFCLQGVDAMQVAKHCMKSVKGGSWGERYPQKEY